jgi:hypothetical protein
MTAAVLHGGLDLGKIAGPVLGGGLATIIGVPATFRVLPLLLLAVYVVTITMAGRSRSVT